MRRELAGQRLGPSEYGEFAGRIMRQQCRAHLCRERRRVDDDAAASVGEQPTRDDLVGEENTAGVDVEVEVPLFVGQVDGAGHGGDAGVGDQNIATAETLEHTREGRLDRGTLADIDMEGVCTGTDFTGDSLCAFEIEVAGGDARAMLAVEDSESGLASASAAGLRTAAIGSDSAGHADWLIDRLTEVVDIVLPSIRSHAGEARE